MLTALTAAVPAHAEDAKPAWHGVWQGTIGALPVQVCLDKGGGDWKHGVYFYLSRKKPISLDHESDGSWSERAGSGGKESGRWVLAASPNGDLRGQWQNGSRILPIALTRTGGKEGQEDACTSRAFIAPLVQAVKTITKRKARERFIYSELIYDVGSNFSDVSISGFSYAPTQPGDKAINAALRLDPFKSVGDADYLSCFQGSFGSLGTSGDFHFSNGPSMATRDYLVVSKSAGGFCGGAHPYHDSFYITYDRQSGKEVKLEKWLAIPLPSSFQEEGSAASAKRTERLKALIMKHFTFDGSECRGDVESAFSWQLGLTRTGLIFTPSLPHVAAACIDDAHVTFAELAPFLSPAGRAGVARLKRK